MDDIRPAAARRRAPAGFLGMLVLFAGPRAAAWLAARRSAVTRGRTESMTPARCRYAARRLPWGLIGMLALVALIEPAVDRMKVSLLNEQALDWVSARERLAGRPIKSDVLCFGDSMVKFGIAPRVLEKELNRTTYSLAMLDGKPSFSYFMLRRALAAGARPSAVVVDFQPEMVCENPINLLQNPIWDFANLDLAESLDVAWHYRDSNFFARLILTRAFPSIGGRLRIRAAITAALQGQPSRTRETNLAIRRNQWVNNGGLLLPRNPGYRGDIPREWVSAMCQTPWLSDPAHVQYIHRFLKLAESHKIAVFWLLPPNAPAVVARRRHNGIFDRYDDFIRRALGRFANLTVLDPRHSGYLHHEFVDAVHLDHHGSKALTFDVADAMKKTLARGGRGSGWVVLPPFHEPPIAMALENIDQSRALVQKQEATRRR